MGETKVREPYTEEQWRAFEKASRAKADQDIEWLEERKLENMNQAIRDAQWSEDMKQFSYILIAAVCGFAVAVIGLWLARWH